jgi:hypothetical protein
MRETHLVAIILLGETGRLTSLQPPACACRRWCLCGTSRTKTAEVLGHAIQHPFHPLGCFRNPHFLTTAVLQAGVALLTKVSATMMSDRVRQIDDECARKAAEMVGGRRTILSESVERMRWTTRLFCWDLVWSVYLTTRALLCYFVLQVARGEYVTSHAVIRIVCSWHRITRLEDAGVSPSAVPTLARLSVDNF